LLRVKACFESHDRIAPIIGRRVAVPSPRIPEEITMLVRSRMSSPPITVRADTSFQQALALMQEHGVRRLPVVDERGALIGIVAQRDVLIAALRYLLSRVDVSEVMARNVISVSPDTSLTEVAKLMLLHKIGGLPVVEGGKVVGVITESDLFRTFVELHSLTEGAAARDAPPRVEWGRRMRGAGTRPID
jgi:CBS domain-containing protein